MQGSPREQLLIPLSILALSGAPGQGLAARSLSPWSRQVPQDEREFFHRPPGFTFQFSHLPSSWPL